MPSEEDADTSAFRERLSVRGHWWVLSGLLVAFGSAEISAGFDWPLGVGVFAVLLAATFALLAGMSRSVVRVDMAGLHAGGRTMSWYEMESAQRLDRKATRLRLGPQADPGAHVVFRGWVGESVLVTPLDRSVTPYWLVSTRRPDELLAAIERIARVVFSAR